MKTRLRCVSSTRAATGQRGFTLIEVMVSLVIVAFSLTAVAASMGQMIDTANAMRERTFASWIAQNKIAEMRLANVVPEVSATSGEVDYANTSWGWRAVVSETDVENLFRVDVTVSYPGSEYQIFHGYRIHRRTNYSGPKQSFLESWTARRGGREMSRRRSRTIRPRIKQRMTLGFTLIEVLVSLAVFGVLSMLAYMTLGQTLSNADLLTDRMERLQAVQRTVRYLSSDLIQASPRPVRLELGDSLGPALLTNLGSEFALELTHGGWGNPAGLPRGTQQRSAYRIEGDELLRYHWNVLDRTYANEPVTAVLLDDVESLLFRYLDSNGEWSDTWPPQLAQGSSSPSSRPRAVEVLLTLVDEGEIRRVLEIAP